jgi:hypothetical protein
MIIFGRMEAGPIHCTEDQLGESVQAEWECVWALPALEGRRYALPWVMFFFS